MPLCSPPPEGTGNVAVNEFLKDGRRRLDEKAGHTAVEGKGNEGMRQKPAARHTTTAALPEGGRRKSPGQLARFFFGTDDARIIKADEKTHLRLPPPQALLPTSCG